MVSQQAQTNHQNPIFLLDGLLCDEHFGEEEEEDLQPLCFQQENIEEKNNTNNKPPLSLQNHDLLWENEELLALLSKEKQTPLNPQDDILMKSRNLVVDWVIRVSSFYGFGGVTVVLAVNYFDRFVSTFCIQEDKPWMCQLVAVACLSLAAKVEETRVPLLIDFQVEESKFVFDSRSIMRMELLVLSSLEWKMNPVTPFSFIDHFIRRLGLKSYPHWQFLRRCESLLLSIVDDSRFLCYLPSVIATATMCAVIKEVDPCNASDYQTELMAILNICKQRVDECYNFIAEVSGSCGRKQCLNHKRKYCPMPSSPNAVIDGYFSCDSSNDSWAVASSVSSSPEPLFKKHRAKDQAMRLAPPNLSSIGVLKCLT